MIAQLYQEHSKTSTLGKMRKIASAGGVSRLKRLQEDNMDYLADILSKASTDVMVNGRPSNIPVLIAENVKCRVTPIRYEEAVKIVSGQSTSLPTVRISFPLNTPVKNSYWIELKNHPDLVKVNIVSKVPRHSTSTAEIVNCTV